MSVTDVDYNKLIKWLLPVRLRTGKMSAWLKALNTSIGSRLYPAFKSWEAKCWYDLKYQTGQVAYLEYVLNDTFDAALKRIKIGPGQNVNNFIYLYLDSEQQPLYLYTDAENKPVWLYTDAELIGGGGGYDFTINVPVGLPNEEATLRAVADRYKRDGKAYEVVYF